MATRRPLRKKDIIAQKIGDECILYDPTRGSVHVINYTAECVLNMCDGVHSLDDMEQHMQESHQVSEDRQLRKDIEAILHDFTDLGIIFS